MKVTMVLGNDFLKPYVDGRVYREARSLSKTGHEVTIVCWARTITNKELKGEPAKERYDGILVKRVFSPISPIGSSVLKRYSQHKKAMWKIAGTIRETPTDVIHCHDFNTLLTVKYLGKNKIHVIYDSHEDFINMIDEVMPGYMLWFARRKEKNILNKYVDRAITVCEPIKKSLEAYGVSDTSLVMNCRDLTDYTIVPPEAVLSLRRKLASDEELILLYIGSIGSDRGLKDLVEVFNKGLEDSTIKKQFGKIKLIMGGMVHLENRMKACIKSNERIKWVGYVPGKKLVEYNLASDIMVVLFNPAKESQRVCLPNKLFEAMAAEKPIIVCEDTEAARIVENEHCGLIVPYGDRRALRDAVIRLAENRSARSKMGKAGFQAAKKTYNWNAQEKILLKIYDEIART